ncbi:ATP-binding protein [Embleya sp. NPDC005971]|uniref:ATP-binding protein n=1 Tax=Embleya sp. NPDC005971 TaxID=3156724 RepID=UPI0033D8C30C
MNAITSDPQLCTLPLTAEPASLAPIRRIIGAQLDLWNLSPLVDLAQLVVTELVTNVIQHACDQRCTVMMRRLSGASVEIAVYDCDPRVPAPQATDELAEEGRGLTMVRLMTTGLRVDAQGATGKVIRCVLGGVACTNE